MKNITIRKILVAFIIVLFFIMIFFSKEVLKPIVISLILAYILNPISEYLNKRGFKRWLSSIIVVAITIVIIALVFIYVIPMITKELMGIISNLPSYEGAVQELIKKAGYEKLPEYLKEVVNNMISKGQSVISVEINDVFYKILNFAMEIPTYCLAPVFVYYFLSDKEFFINKIKFFIPISYRNKSVELGMHINRVVKGYFLSQVWLSLIVFLLTLISLLLIGVKYPLVIALINGIANIIPYFGPIIGYVPALLFSLIESGNKAIIITVVFFLIQQIEANIIAPKLVSDCTGMHPVEVMVVLLIGGCLFGGVGLILSVPIAATIKISYKYIVRNMY